MKRHILTFAASVLLVLALANVWLWLRSNERLDFFALEWHLHDVNLQSRNGEMYWQLRTWTRRPPGQLLGWCDNEPPMRWRVEHRSRYMSDPMVFYPATASPVLGVNFEYLRSQAEISYMSYSTDIVKLQIPNWLTLALTLLPLAWVVWRLTGGRPREGRCPGCDYDLRASAGSCPECGTVIDDMPHPNAAAAPIKINSPTFISRS